MRAGICLIVLAGLLSAGAAAAGAWTRAEGDSFMSFTGRAYRASGYQKHSSEFYGELGLTDAVTVGAALGYEQDSVLLREATVRGFVRARLWRGDAATLSVEISGEYLAASDNAGGPFDARGSNAAWVGLAYGRGLETRHGPGWAEAAAAFRKRFGDDADEFRLDLTAGLRPSENWVAYAQALGTLGLRNAGQVGTDYDLLKLSVSAGYRITETRTFILSVTKDVLGRNQSRGVEAAMTIWIDY